MPTCLGEQSSAWTAVTAAEMYAYMGFMMLMGIVKLPSVRDYWKQDLVLRYLPIADLISRDRFLEIHRYLHFANNETLSAPGSQEYNKLGKIRPITALSTQFKTIYEPGKHISIDDTL